MEKLIFVLFLFCVNVFAGELSFSVGQRSMNLGEDDYNVEDWNYIQISYQPDGSKFYYFVSREEAEVAPAYFVWTYTMTGLGVGTRANITKNIRFFGQLGYYKIDNDFGHKANTNSEGTDYFFNSKFNGLQSTGKWISWTDIQVENDNAFGGTFGIEILQPLSENITVGYSVSHRLIKINEEYNVRKPAWWAVSPNRDYSSTNFSINLNYNF